MNKNLKENKKTIQVTLLQITYSLPTSLATCVSAAPEVPYPGETLFHIPDIDP